jgi:predicted DNA-binding transcriptional regulator AlpA
MIEFKPQDCLLLSRVNAAAYLGISISLLLTEVAKGNLPAPRHIGSRALWVRAELDRAFGVEAKTPPDVPQEPSDRWDLA